MEHCVYFTDNMSEIMYDQICLDIQKRNLVNESIIKLQLWLFSESTCANQIVF